jgi:hypothetical protein
MKSRWITHRGTEIFYIDLSDLGMDVGAFDTELKAASAITRQQPEDSLRVLTDVRNTTITTPTLRASQQYSAQTVKYVYKTAIIGIQGFRRVFLDAVSLFSGQKFSQFEDLEAALDWLVED